MAFYVFGCKEVRIMSYTEYTVLSSDTKTNLHTVLWKPSGTVKAVVQIVHGIAEHALRYADFAHFLNEQGFAVLAHDHIGHGGSQNAENIPVYFGTGNSWATATDDIGVVAKSIPSDLENTPLFLLGHSMGSFLVRSFLIRYPTSKRAGAIIMGTGWQNPAKLGGGLFIARILAKKGAHRVSTFANKLAFGSYNKPFAPNRTAFDWLSADTDNVDAYIADPLCGQAATVGIFREMLSGIAYNQSKKNISHINKNLPILLISGNSDPVGDMGKGVKKTFAHFKKAGVKDCTITLYPHLRHEILNEKQERTTVFNDILNWLETRLH